MAYQYVLTLHSANINYSLISFSKRQTTYSQPHSKENIKI